MKRMKSFEGEGPILYLVATPIGNLDELTPRAKEILSMVDVIAAEDTRNTMKLLSHFDIHTKLVAHHMHNEHESAKGLLNYLVRGQDVALVSDAGYPLISDPGAQVVKLVSEAGFRAVPISGANAALNALVASGITPQPFLFYGFLKSNEKERLKELHRLKCYETTLIFYEAPHRLKKTLTSMLKILGNRQICIARELTKRHEEFIRGHIMEIIDIVDDIKGEIVIVVEGAEESQVEIISMSMISEKISVYIEEGLSTSDAIKRIAKETGLSKNEIYKEYHNEC